MKKTNPIKLKWNSICIALHYKIIVTEITVLENGSRTYNIDGDVWKIVNTGNEIYLFSDSINTPICVNKIDANGNFSKIYNLTEHNHSIDFKELSDNKRSPLLRLLPHNNFNKNKTPSAIFFIHGGPHQKAGNLWDPLFSAFLQQNYLIYVSQYPGTFGVEGDGVANYGIDDFEDLIFHYDQIKQTHHKVILVGHSYGAFLGLKLFLKKGADIFVGINGVYDLLTISSLNPKTYANLGEQEKISRSPKCPHTTSETSGEWHHIQFERDPLIKSHDLEGSLNKVGGNGPMIHYLNFEGHGTFNRTQSSHIVELIKMIEHQFYYPLNRQSYEQIYC